MANTDASLGAKYTAYNVLDDPELRENVKEYSYVDLFALFEP